MTDVKYLLARIRALGVAAPVGDRAGLNCLGEAADQAGRRLIDVLRPGREPGITLGWQVGDEPSVMSEPLSDTCRQATVSVQLALAACLRCCWPDPAEPLYPGGTAAETAVFRALDRLRSPASGPEPGEVGKGVHSSRRSALRILRACGFLEPDAGDGVIRLGPTVALWTPADISELARNHHLLPSPGEPNDRH